MFRSVFIIMKGTGLAQLVGFLTLPLLTRVLQPDAFGQFQVFQSIIMLVFVIVMLRYEIAIVRATELELPDVLALCCLLVFVNSLILTVVLFFASLTDWFGFPVRLNFGWWWISLSTFILGFGQILLYLTLREANYATIANGKIAQALANASVGAAIALTVPIGSTLIIADLAGRVASCLWLARDHCSCISSKFRTSWTQMWAAAVQHRDLSLISLPGSLLSTAGSVMTPLLIYANFNAFTSGQFALVDRAVGLPIALIVGAISQVHVGNLAEDLRENSDFARRSFRRLAITVAGLALLPTVACVIFAPAMFALLFGPGWDQAARFAQMLAPAFFCGLVAGGVNMTLTVMGKQLAQLGWDASRFVVIALLWIYAPSAGWSVDSIVQVYSALLCLFSAAHLVLSYQVLSRGTVVVSDIVVRSE